MDNDQDNGVLEPQTKKQRIEEPSTQQSPVASTPVQDADDFYGVTEPAAPHSQTTLKEISSQNENPDQAQPILHSSIPGLALLKDASQSFVQQIHGLTEACMPKGDEQPVVESVAFDQSAISDPTEAKPEISTIAKINGHDQKDERGMGRTKIWRWRWRWRRKIRKSFCLNFDQNSLTCPDVMSLFGYGYGYDFFYRRASIGFPVFRNKPTKR